VRETERDRQTDRRTYGFSSDALAPDRNMKSLTEILNRPLFVKDCHWRKMAEVAETRNPKHKTRNQEPETRNPKPET